MSSVPAGARCGRHPEVGAIALCARCGDFLCDDCAIAIEGRSYCAACEPLAGDAFPWERRAEIGVVRALFATTIGTLVYTRPTFARGFRDRSVLPALAYCTVMSTPIAWMRVAIELAGRTPERAAAERAPLVGWLSSDAGILAQAIAAPIVVVVSVAVWAAAWWLGLIVMQTGRRRWSHVVRSVAYAQGAVAPLTILAVLPQEVGLPLTILATLYGPVLMGRALSAITGASGWRIAGAGIVMIFVLAGLSFLTAAALASLPVL